MTNEPRTFFKPLKLGDESKFKMFWNKCYELYIYTMRNQDL